MSKEIQIDLSAGPDPLPKAGDTVNYVQAVNKIVPAKVILVVEKTEGRIVTVQNPDPKGKEAIRLTHRSRAALAGNTWHWPAKAAALLIGLIILGAGIATALANLPTYHTFSGTGSSTSPATVLMPADPNSQIRVVSVFYQDDGAGTFSFSTGGTAYSLIATNPASFTTNVIGNTASSTNGLFVGQALLQHNGVCYTNKILSWNTSTNATGTGTTTNQQWYVVTQTGFAAPVSIGDEIYMMTNSATWLTGPNTNQLNGDDIYSGNYGRPVELQLIGASSVNGLNSVGTHYDSASQP